MFKGPIQQMEVEKCKGKQLQWRHWRDIEQDMHEILSLSGGEATYGSVT